MTEICGEEGGNDVETACILDAQLTYGCIHACKYSYTQISILQMEEPKGKYCFV